MKREQGAWPRHVLEKPRRAMLVRDFGASLLPGQRAMRFAVSLFLSVDAGVLLPATAACMEDSPGAPGTVRVLPMGGCGKAAEPAHQLARRDRARPRRYVTRVHSGV